jgi:hypothetical protein
LGLWAGYFALWLAATTVVAASLKKSGVATDNVVTDHVVNIFLRVGGFLELSVSKDNDLIYDLKCGHHFLKLNFNFKKPQKTLKSNFENLKHLFRPKIFTQPH